MYIYIYIYLAKAVSYHCSSDFIFIDVEVTGGLGEQRLLGAHQGLSRRLSYSGAMCR